MQPAQGDTDAGSATDGDSVPIVKLHVSDAVRTRLTKGEPQDLIVVLATRSAAKSRVPNVHASLRAQVLRDLAGHRVKAVRDYSHIPYLVVRASESSVLEALEASGAVAAVYENETYRPASAEALTAMNWTAVASPGAGSGDGLRVAIIDGEVTHAFAGLTKQTADGATGSDATVDSHANAMAQAILTVAPGASLHSIDVYSEAQTDATKVLDALNKVIALDAGGTQITAVNLSFAGSLSTSNANCDTNPLHDAIDTLVNTRGVLVVAAAGNSKDNNKLAQPACDSNVISVGSTYDADLTANATFFPSAATNVPAGSECTELASAGKQGALTCFSNFSDQLTLLAPGAFLSLDWTGDSTPDNTSINRYGTSYSAALVSGAVLAIADRYPSEDLGFIKARLTSSSKTGTRASLGTRNKPVLDLTDALVDRCYSLLSGATDRTVSFGVQGGGPTNLTMTYNKASCTTTKSGDPSWLTTSVGATSSSAPYQANVALSAGVAGSISAQYATVTCPNASPIPSGERGAQHCLLLSGGGTSDQYVVVKQDGDSTAPSVTGVVTIEDGGDEITSTTDVTVSVLVSAASDNATPAASLSYCITDSTTSASCQWSTLGAGLPKTVTGNATLNVGDGTKTVRFYVRDLAGKVSTALTDTTVLDTKAPAAGALNVTSNANDVSLSFNAASDSGSSQVSYALYRSTTSPATCTGTPLNTWVVGGTAATGSVTALAADTAGFEGAALTIADGTNTQTFELDSNASVTSGNRTVTYIPTTTVGSPSTSTCTLNTTAYDRAETTIVGSGVAPEHGEIFTVTVDGTQRKFGFRVLPKCIVVDAGPDDAGPGDAGPVDAGPVDAGAPEPCVVDDTIAADVVIDCLTTSCTDPAVVATKIVSAIETSSYGWKVTTTVSGTQDVLISHDMLGSTRSVTGSIGDASALSAINVVKLGTGLPPEEGERFSIGLGQNGWTVVSFEFDVHRTGNGNGVSGGRVEIDLNSGSGLTPEMVFAAMSSAIAAHATVSAGLTVSSAYPTVSLTQKNVGTAAGPATSAVTYSALTNESIASLSAVNTAEIKTILFSNANDVAQLLTSAINAAPSFNVTATRSGSTVNLRNDVKSHFGNIAIVASDAVAPELLLASAGMSGGEDVTASTVTFVDTTAVTGETYYYVLCATDAAGFTSSGATATGRARSDTTPPTLGTLALVQSVSGRASTTQAALVSEGACVDASGTAGDFCYSNSDVVVEFSGLPSDATEYCLSPSNGSGCTDATGSWSPLGSLTTCDAATPAPTGLCANVTIAASSLIAGNRSYYVWVRDADRNVSNIDPNTGVVTTANVPRLGIYYDATPPSDGVLTVVPDLLSNRLSWSSSKDSASGNRTFTVRAALSPAVPAEGCGGSGEITTFINAEFDHDANAATARISETFTGARAAPLNGYITDAAALTAGDTLNYRVCITDRAGNTSRGMLGSALIRPETNGPVPVGTLTSATRSVLTQSTAANCSSNMKQTTCEGDADHHCQWYSDSGTCGANLVRAGNSAWTKKTRVRIWVEAEDASAVKDVCLSTTSVLRRSCTTWKDYQAQLDPSEEGSLVSFTSQDGVKHVSAWVRDEWGNISDSNSNVAGEQPYRDRINVDRTAPTIATVSAVKTGATAVTITVAGIVEPVVSGFARGLDLDAGNKSIEIYARVGTKAPDASACSARNPNGLACAPIDLGSSHTSGSSYTCIHNQNNAPAGAVSPIRVAAGKTYSYRACVRDALDNWSRGTGSNAVAIP